jgi:DNA-binding NtrC family response regulator
VERVYVQRVLDSRGGDKAEAARLLGINRRTLYRMLGRTFKARAGTNEPS